jgi:hypothetical protein
VNGVVYPITELQSWVGGGNILLNNFLTRGRSQSSVWPSPGSPAPSKKLSSSKMFHDLVVPCLPNKPKQQTKTTTTTNENQKPNNTQKPET